MDTLIAHEKEKMKEVCTYSSRDLSRILGVSEETVRRWARNGEIGCSQSSRKEGYSFTGDEIVEFMTSHPRYISKAINADGKVSYSGFLVKRLMEEIDISKGRVKKLRKELEREELSIAKNEKLLRDFLSGKD